MYFRLVNIRKTSFFFLCLLLNGTLLRLKASNVVREFSRGFAAAWRVLGVKFATFAFNFDDPNMFELVRAWGISSRSQQWWTRTIFRVARLPLAPWKWTGFCKDWISECFCLRCDDVFDVSAFLLFVCCFQQEVNTHLTMLSGVWLTQERLKSSRHPKIRISANLIDLFCCRKSWWF